MPPVRIERRVPVARTARVQQVGALFDVPPCDQSAVDWEIDLSELGTRDWTIGLIAGPSGSGKTTVARTLWPDAYVEPAPWPADAAIVDAMPEAVGTDAIVGTFSAVGFGSVPSWLRPYRVLSTGEQFRASLARALLERPTGLLVIDEFTSVVDRQVAQIIAHAMQRHVRKSPGRQLIALSCHYDILEWLQPDWLFEPHVGTLTWRVLRRHPPLRFRVAAVGADAWPRFRQHHYLSGKLVPGSVCFGAFLERGPWADAVAFASVRRLPHASARNIMMGGRLVVLPDYQGLGLGGAFDDWLGEYLYRLGWRYHNSVAHPAMIAHYSQSRRWHRLGGDNKSSQVAYRFSSARHGRGSHAWNQHFKPRRFGLQSFAYQPAVELPIGLDFAPIDLRDAAVRVLGTEADVRAREAVSPWAS